MSNFIQPGQNADGVVFGMLKDVLSAAREGKPEDRSAKARCYAVVITMLEQAVAYFAHFIIGTGD